MEALGQLTGGVAHDFNNMLTLMLGGLDTIDRQLVQLPASPAKARIERAKDMALQGVQRARALTGRLLAFSRRQALAPQAVDANALVGGIGDLLQRTLGEPIALDDDSGGRNLERLRRSEPARERPRSIWRSTPATPCRAAAG